MSTENQPPLEENITDDAITVEIYSGRYRIEIEIYQPEEE